MLALVLSFQRLSAISILMEWIQNRWHLWWSRHWRHGLKGRRQRLFNSEDLKCLDDKYFNIIAVDDYDVTVMSRNTGHYWYLHNPEYPGEGTVIIFHKHKFSHPYHQHGRANTLRQAVKGIKSHDKWQMGGRKTLKA